MRFNQYSNDLVQYLLVTIYENSQKYIPYFYAKIIQNLIQEGFKKKKKKQMLRGFELVSISFP